MADGLKGALEALQGEVRQEGEAHLVYHDDCEEPGMEDMWCVVVVVVVCSEKVDEGHGKSVLVYWCRSLRSNWGTWNDLH